MQEYIQQTLTSFWCLYCRPFSSISIVDFEQVNICPMRSCSVYCSIQSIHGNILNKQNFALLGILPCGFSGHWNNDDMIFLIKVWLKNREFVKQIIVLIPKGRQDSLF